MPPPPSLATLLSPESLVAAGRGADKLSLLSLQSKMKCDPDGYQSELLLLYRHFDSSLHLFRQQSALSPSSDPAVAKELADLSMFLAHVTPFYPDTLVDFPRQLAELLQENARALPSGLRCHLAQALILLVNRKTLDIEETLELFMDLQTFGDRTLKKLAYTHVVHTIKRMNQKHKNESQNRKLQNILFLMLQGEEELRAKRALVTFCELHRRRVWFDERTANAICAACFHSSSKILIAALSFLLGYERVTGDEGDSDNSSDEDDEATQQPHVVLSREAVYKAHNKGTTASKKKKKAKLQRVMRNMKRQQRIASQNSNFGHYSPLSHLKDAQGFVEKLFSRLQNCNERFEGYVQPHQPDITELLAAAVQSCHDMVPPDAVEPLFKQIVNRFIHDRSRTEAIAVGLNVVREICLRMPLLMSEDLLQDLVLYKKSHEKAISIAARSLISLFREICPSLLTKKDRGRPINPKAKPKAYGEVDVVSDVPGIELLQADDDSITDSSGEEASISDMDSDAPSLAMSNGTNCDDEASSDEENVSSEDIHGVDSDEENEGNNEEFEEMSEDCDNTGQEEDDCHDFGLDESENDDEDSDNEDSDEDTELKSREIESSEAKLSKRIINKDHANNEDVSDDCHEIKELEKCKTKKRKNEDYDQQVNNTESSLRALKRLAGAKKTEKSSDKMDGILSNEDFKRIKELRAKMEAKLMLSQQGLLKKGSDSKLKIPSADQLGVKRVDPAMFEAHVKRRLTKEERLELVRAGREDREKYRSRTAVKQKKTGGLSNRQKEHKKFMPIAAKRAKGARSRQEKKKQKRSGKQFRGKKAWK